MEEKIIKTSTIEVKVGLNENNLPIRMKWSADDGGVLDAEAKAMLLSLWDPKSNKRNVCRRNEAVFSSNTFNLV